MASGDDLRKQLRNLIGLASRLGGLLVDAQLPPLELAQAKVEAVGLAHEAGLCQRSW